jgi:two-component sensor histidine kinase
LIANELVANALKHGNDSVELSLAVQNDQVVLEVCDDGPGFPAEFNALANANTGLELVESLVVTDLLGEARFENRIEGGARVRVVFALPGFDQ